MILPGTCALQSGILSLNLAAMSAGMYSSLQPKAFTDAQLLRTLILLTQHPLGASDLVFMKLLCALDTSSTIRRTLAARDGWRQLCPLAASFVATRGCWLTLTHWLNDARSVHHPAPGPLQTPLVFALLLDCSIEAVPLAATAADLEHHLGTAQPDQPAGVAAGQAARGSTDADAAREVMEAGAATSQDANADTTLASAGALPLCKEMDAQSLDCADPRE
jgi:hypothetical protein